MFSFYRSESAFRSIICVSAGVLLFILFIWYALKPILLLEGNGKEILSVETKVGDKFSTHFTHSVQKTPVEEFFIVNDNCDGFILRSTRYRSFGVGLPFLSSDGNFRRENDYFIMDDLNRPIKTLDLRTGVDSELSITIGNETVKLYEIMPLGTLFRVSIIPRYKFWIKSFMLNELENNLTKKQ